MSTFPEYKTASVSSLIPYARNSRTHSDEQVAKIAASIKEFSFLNPVIVDGENGIIAGHGRVMAAQKLGMETVPVIEASHLTNAQRRAYVIADNRLALESGWDDEMLRVEFAELEDLGFDLELTGFDIGEIDELKIDEDGFGGDGASIDGDNEKDNPYTGKVEGLIYEPTGADVAPSEAYNCAKVNELVSAIESSAVTGENKALLLAAATRHYVFDYSKIAEIYSNANDEVKKLMEQSALVIVDYDRAIELGYAKIKEAISNDFNR